MKFIWIEILKFIKNNIMKIVLGTALITVGFVWINNRSTTMELDDNSESKGESVVEVDSEPATFRFFIENSEGAAFTNNLLIEQYITRSSVLETVSNETNTNLLKLIEETGNSTLVNYNESGESKIIGIARDGNSHLLEFYVNIGNETDNLKIANYYFAYITEENIPFIANKSISVFHEPRIKDLTDEITFDSIDNQGSVVRSITKNIVIGLILGLVVTVSLLLILSFLSQKLVYSFSYSLGEDDFFFLIDKKLDYKDELIQILSMPTNSNRVVILENNVDILNEELNGLLSSFSGDENFSKYNNILDVVNPGATDRIIYVLQENKTSREWYNKQRRLGRAYDIPTIVIQVNDN